ncbi:MAG TPA: HEAT repeat domain-containing protein [Bacteroidota bacterium]|nr:HEAT repeat domain-containing protein [Bacteroidota bacterium]
MNDETRRNIATLITDEDSDERRHAAEDLASERGLAAIAALAAAIQDANKGVRDTACRSLLAIGGPEAARAVVEYVASREIVTRNLATDLLVKIGEPGVPALLPYLSDVNHDVRKSVVDVLGLIGPSVPVVPVRDLLADGDQNVVVSAVEALGNMRNPDAVAALEEAYARHAWARPAVAEALGKIAAPASAFFVRGRLAEALAGADVDPLALLGLLEAAGAVCGTDALPLIAGHYGALPSGLRGAALHAIVRIAVRYDSPLPPLAGVRETLVAMLADAGSEAASSAAAWLKTLDGEDVTAALAGAYGSSAELDAVLGPALRDRPDALSCMVSALEGDSGSGARAKAALLSQLVLARIRSIMRRGRSAGDEGLIPRGFEAIARAWDRADQDTRSSLIDAMFRLDGDRAVQFLDAVMEQPDPWLRMHVIEVIAAIADSRAPVYIARFLDDEDEMVRELADNLLRAKGFVADEP